MMQCQFCKAQVPDGTEKCPQCGSALPENVTPQRQQGVNQAPDDFGRLFSDATTIWKNNLGDLVILSLVLILVGWIPIANAGFFAGYYRSILKVMRGQGKAQVGDLFNAWDCFGNMLLLLVISFIAMLIVSLVPIIGTLAGLALCIVVAPAMFSVVDKGLNAIDSIKWSIETIKKDAMNWVLAGLVGSVLSGVGAIALLIGIIVTMPLGTLITAGQYERRKND